MELINRDKLLEVMEKRKRPENGADGSKERYRYMQWLADYWAIKDASTIDAVEVVHGEWIPFKTRTMTEEEKEIYPDDYTMLDCLLPDDGERILVTVNCKGHESVQYDEYYDDGGESYLDSGYEIGTEAIAWMPLPKPYGERKEGK